MTTHSHLHIVSFDIPYPPNYGGVIDVYYKLKALAGAGIKIHLHCFEYHRERAPHLNELCHSVNYYRRKTGLRAALNLQPYIVASRKSESLLYNLRQDNYPILFEGLHSCYFLDAPELKDRMRIYRESNIEHLYYLHLSRAEKNLLKKIYFLTASLKLKWFQKKLTHADLMLTVSIEDTTYLQRHFPGKKVIYLPSFHRDDEVKGLTGKGDYLLYQGNLSVAENIRAAEFLIRDVIEEGMPHLIIAGLNPPAHLIRLAAGKKNVQIVADPDDETMFNLIRKAHVNLMVTFQATGLKLKLLNALFNGRFCLVNPQMVAGTSLGKLCTIADHPDQFREKIRLLFTLEYTGAMITERCEGLMDNYSNQKNCRILTDLLHLL